MNVNTEICKAFNDHAVQYEQAAQVQYEIGERLFERLDLIKMNPRVILDLGCGPGVFSKRLKKRYPNAQIIGFDLALGMLLQAKKKQSFFRKWPLIQGDMAIMPFASGLFDLIFSNQVIHWSPSLSSVFSELYRVMNVSGCLMFSTLGPDTFYELRKAWSTVDSHAHANDFVDMHDIGDCLLAEQFLDPVIDMEKLSAHYATLPQLLQALKAQGVRNIHALRKTGLTGRDSWRSFEQSMLGFCTDQGKFPLTYEVVYGHAWKGEPRRMEKGRDTMISVEQLRNTYHNRSSS
jgi:malonyl-CoA O-methyltransferase